MSVAISSFVIVFHYVCANKEARANLAYELGNQEYQQTDLHQRVTYPIQPGQ